MSPGTAPASPLAETAGMHLAVHVQQQPVAALAVLPALVAEHAAVVAEHDAVVAEHAVVAAEHAVVLVPAAQLVPVAGPVPAAQLAPVAGQSIAVV